MRNRFIVGRLDLSGFQCFVFALSLHNPAAIAFGVRLSGF